MVLVVPAVGGLPHETAHEGALGHDGVGRVEGGRLSVVVGVDPPGLPGVGHELCDAFRVVHTLAFRDRHGRPHGVGVEPALLVELRGQHGSRQLFVLTVVRCPLDPDDELLGNGLRVQRTPGRLPIGVDVDGDEHQDEDEKGEHREHGRHQAAAREQLGTGTTFHDVSPVAFGRLLLDEAVDTPVGVVPTGVVQEHGP